VRVRAGLVFRISPLKVTGSLDHVTVSHLI
jgi:hypothetical protein